MSTLLVNQSFASDSSYRSNEQQVKIFYGGLSFRFPEEILLLYGRMKYF